MSDSNPPTEHEIFEIVAAKIAEQKDIDPSAVSIDATFESLAVDSLDGMEALFELEEALDVDVPDQAARSLLTPQTTVRAVVEGLGKLTRGEEIEVPDPPPGVTSEAASDDAAPGDDTPKLPDAAEG
jgi:acyl carrier protein